MDDLFIGVQGAAKRGVIAVCCRDGTIVELEETGPLTMRVNPNLREELLQHLKRLCEKLSMTIKDLAQHSKGVCVAMSGVYQEGDIYAGKQMLVDIGLVGDFNPIVCEDVWAGIAAAGYDSGGTTWASTGCNVLIRNQEGDKFVRVGGWGSDISDLGGGYDIGMKAINAILDSEDGRRAGSHRLKSEVLDWLHLMNVQQLVPWYHAVRKTPFWRAKIADIAIIVRRLAEEDFDFQATDIFYSGSRELARSLSAALHRGAIERVFSEGDQLTMVLEGGLLRNSKIYQSQIQAFLEHMKTSIINWNCELLKCHPVVGALSFAISGRKQLPAKDVYERIKLSAKKVNLMYPEIENE